MSSITGAIRATDTLSAIELIESCNTATVAKKVLIGDDEKTYRKLFRFVHPDVTARQVEPIKSRGEKAAYKLNAFRDEINGKNKVSTPPSFGKWIVEQTVGQGDIADIYAVVSTTVPHAILKIVRNPKDNDLMEQEIEVLKTSCG